jgi:hypothetical protein
VEYNVDVGVRLSHHISIETPAGNSIMPKKRSRKNSPERVNAVVGLGLDADDGHKRITRTEEMVLLGGSEETHERMQETAIRFSEGLEKRGKTLGEASVPEVIDLLRESIEKQGK